MAPLKHNSIESRGLGSATGQHGLTLPGQRDQAIPAHTRERSAMACTAPAATRAGCGGPSGAWPGTVPSNAIRS